MSDRALVERLRGHRQLQGVPESELEWLARRGTLTQLTPDDPLASRDAEITSMYVMLSGRIAMYTTRGGERRKAAEWTGGDLLGLLPYSRMKSPPGDLVCTEPSDFLEVHRDLFPEMVRECHEITSRQVHVMIDRARIFTSTDLHDEKLAALGRMAAGLAHELNNPTAAVVSGARALVGKLTEAAKATRALGAAGLGEEQLAAIDKLNLACCEDVADVRSPLEQSDFEESIADWLDDHGADVDHVDALAQTDLSLELLDELAAKIEGEALDAALRWVAAFSGGRRLALEVEQAASSIHDLVRAVQGFTSMDRALVAEPMDVGPGLRTAMLVLKAKARDAETGLSIEIEKDLPKVNGFVGELNQIWVNLIANAIDATSGGGRVEVRSSREGKWVVVRVVDDGPGISEDDRQHIFEPFFTTKKIGDGMGLGLQIVRRLVVRNDGEIEVESEPGRTEFRVRLPALEEG